MKKQLLTLLLCGGSFAFAQQPVDYVNPFIGTSNFGTTNPGAVCPQGMMSVTPFNVMGSETNEFDKDSRWWSTPYTSDNDFFTGYAHVNLSGVGCPELGGLLLMPTSGELKVDYHEYGSHYEKEVAHPGYYSNMLTKYNIKTEVTATPRTGLSRFTFPKGQGNILLNLGEGLTNETGATVRFVSDTEIEGSKLMGTFCYNPQAVFPIYFVMQVKGHQRAEAGRTEDVAARNGNRYSFGIYRCDELYQYRAWQYIRQKAGNCNIRKHWHDRKTTAQAAFDRRDVLCGNFAFPDGNGGTWH